MAALAQVMLVTDMTTKRADEISGIGGRLKLARERAGYKTQSELADAIDVRAQTIWRIETGGHTGARSTLDKIADALKVSRAWLEHGVGEAPPPRTDQVEAVEAYLKSEVGHDTPPEVARRLRVIDWDVFSDGKPGVKEIHRVREAIESNLKGVPNPGHGAGRGKK
jgi:transcriptional regulator with XRE-family HTH domain